MRNLAVLRRLSLAAVVASAGFAQSNWQLFVPNSVTRDSSGAVLGASGTLFNNFPVTQGAYQTTFVLTNCAKPSSLTLPPFIACPHGVIAKYSPQGDSIIWATYLGGSGSDTIYTMVLDPAGNVWVAGDTTSQDFPVTTDALQKTFSGHFLAELSADGSQLLYSSFTSLASGTTLTADPNGFIYLVGMVKGPPFPATPGAFASVPVPGVDNLFAVKFDSVAKRVVYTTLIGPVEYFGATLADSTGRLYIAGSTTDSTFPVTPGVFSHRSLLYDVFLTAIKPDGSDLVFSTVIGGSGDDGLIDMVRDDSGNLYVTALTGGVLGGPNGVVNNVMSPDIPVTPDAAQPNWGPVILMKLSPDASQLLYSSYLGHDGLTTYGLLGGDIAQMKLSPDGKLHIFWTSAQSDIPLTPDSFGPCYPEPIANNWSYVRLTSDLKSIEYATVGGILSPISYPPYYFDTSGRFYIRGTGANYFDILDVSHAAQTGPACMVDSVTQGQGPVAPGLLVSIYGRGIGASQPTHAVADSSGRVTSTLAGTQVLFDGIPSPILFTGPSHIDTVVPFGVATSGNTTVAVLQDGTSLGTLTAALQPSMMRLFSTDGTGFGAVFWNQDGTPNSPTNPANIGDILTLYLTGAGQMTPQPLDGMIPSVPTSVPVNALSMFDIQCPITYAGDAPGQVEGIVQVNCQLQKSVRIGGGILGVVNGVVGGGSDLRLYELFSK